MDELPAPEPTPEKKAPDLRFTNRVDQGVSIDRDLSGQGHLARGSHTRMSEIRFSVQAKPRTYLDPELQALHADGEAPTPTHLKQQDTADAAPLATHVVQAAPDVSTEIAAPSLLGRFTGGIRRWFTGH